MNAREFFYLVSNMRQVQQKYFKTKDQMYLRASKRLEGEVDEEIARVKALYGE